LDLFSYWPQSAMDAGPRGGDQGQAAAHNLKRAASEGQHSSNGTPRSDHAPKAPTDCAPPFCRLEIALLTKRGVLLDSRRLNTYQLQQSPAPVIRSQALHPGH